MYNVQKDARECIISNGQETVIEIKKKVELDYGDGKKLDK